MMSTDTTRRPPKSGEEHLAEIEGWYQEQQARDRAAEAERRPCSGELARQPPTSHPKIMTNDPTLLAALVLWAKETFEEPFLGGAPISEDHADALRALHAYAKGEPISDETRGEALEGLAAFLYDLAPITDAHSWDIERRKKVDKLGASEGIDLLEWEASDACHAALSG